ncbi:hypothetical protein D1B33_04720 [Lysinibacillus yapensis]|uniref:Uncharacterized protein n=1 Tax=Ureibacillus yapensis TaxID=2304605 RepID=A0A396SHK8_9BACL|nr:hypothetical protein D1B33_04720 [Lysinibacillus yapensis]
MIIVKISELIHDFKMKQQIQAREDNYNEYHLAMNYFTAFLMFIDICNVSSTIIRFTSVK